MYEHILVSTDGSALSNRAVKAAIDLASEMHAGLVALHVMPRYPANSYMEDAVGISRQHIARQEKAWADKATTIVEGVVKAARAHGLQAKTAIARSNLVGEAIIDAAKRNKCDLVVMASHGRKGIKRVLLGSETQYVLTHAKIPVLVLR